MSSNSTNNHALRCLLSVVASVGCRQQVTINGQNVATNKQLLGEGAPQAASQPLPASKAAPIALPGALSAPHQYAQTRGSFTLSVGAEAFAIGDTYSVIDETDTQTLVDHQMAPPSGDLSLVIYPLDPVYTGKLTYGDNQISLSVDNAVPKTAKTTLHLQDFSLFAIATLVFPDGTQRSGGLQGGFSPWHQDIVVGKGTSTLSTGLVPAGNQ